MLFHIRLMLLALSVCCANSFATAADDRWWPVQKMPASVVRTSEKSFPYADDVLATSLLGLAAKAVNQGTGDEMIWLSSENRNYEAWYVEWLKQNPGVKTQNELGLWELVDRFAGRGLIKGYILFARDSSEGNLNEHRKGMNQSVNIATSLSGLLDGVVVDESLEAEARKHGLKLLIDARDKTLKWCFETYRDRFNRKLLCAQDTKKPHLRDLAIAQQAFVIYGNEEPYESVLKWLEPLSPIAGWNGGDEFKTTRLSTFYGHFQTGTDWCLNAPLLMSGSELITDPPRQKPIDPREIDFNDHLNHLSFVMTDGDNVQFLQSDFFRGSPSYWDCPDRGKMPFGWSCCFTHLAQLCPPVIKFTLETKKNNDRMIEWGGGYYYPDLFAKARPNGNALLAEHARRTAKMMERSGAQIIGFNVAKIDSADALRAYQTIAGETDDVLAILAFQYVYYVDGVGKIFWVKNRRGIEIPVVTARYSIWEHLNKRPRMGTPAKVAREIIDSVKGKSDRNEWVVTHAWSYFRQAPGTNEIAEDMDQATAEQNGGVRGYIPATWCAERLPSSVKIVSPDELVWRIRMSHDAVTTKKLIAEFGSR